MWSSPTMNEAVERLGGLKSLRKSFSDTKYIILDEWERCYYSRICIYVLIGGIYHSSDLPINRSKNNVIFSQLTRFSMNAAMHITDNNSEMNSVESHFARLAGKAKISNLVINHAIKLFCTKHNLKLRIKQFSGL